ncbi:MAG TPA: NAD(P)-dependent oxidoreductase [Myxococcota bacterium]|nr:NAD(P)-dependent oxidoreductase [Myxococcota bacterium]
MSRKLGWIGLGVMGASMCAHLRRAGHDMTVYTRTPARAEECIALGCAWAESPRAVAEAAEVVFAMVGFPRDVREVALGEDGALAGLRPGGILVDMTTSEPALAVEIAVAARARGAWALDAPVSGGDVGAREARLSIMVGGDTTPFDAVQPLFALLGRTIVHHGGPGTGQHAKMVNQILIASNMVGVCEGLLYAHSAGLDPERVLASVSGGAAGSWSLANLAPRMLAGDFRPGFYVEHFVKDMEIALREAGRMKLTLPGLALAKRLYERLAASGHARSGTQAFVLALAELSGLEWPPGRA